MSLALSRSRLVRGVPDGGRCLLPGGPAASIAGVAGARPVIRRNPSNFQTRGLNNTAKVSCSILASWIVLMALSIPLP